MKNIVIVLFVAGTLLGCKEEETTQPIPEQVISTSLSSADTLGCLSTTFLTGNRFYLTFTLKNSTGKDQPYFFTGPISEIYISRNDTIVSRQYYGYIWPQVVIPGVLKKDSTLINQWLAPSSFINPNLTLASGTYVVDVFVNAHFDNIEIQNLQRIQLTILDTNRVVVYKPNIYLYPKTTRSLSINLEFPLGGSVIQSVPSYSNGWNVSVEPSGKIDQLYNYLFYESTNPDAFQYYSGWVVSKDTLSSFFSNTLLRAGFSVREKDDFIEYWIPRLTDYPNYLVFPQFAEDIGKVIRLKTSETPDNMLRLFYVIKGTTNKNQNLFAPIIPPFVRTGFSITEWGVILK